MLAAHVERMRATGADVFQLPLPDECRHGTYFPPTLITISDVRALTAEVFGPVLHVVRFRRATSRPSLHDSINATGLRPDPWRADANRRNRRGDRCAHSREHLRQSQHHWRGRRCSRSAATACPARAPRPADRMAAARQRRAAAAAGRCERRRRDAWPTGDEPTRYICVRADGCVIAETEANWPHRRAWRRRQATSRFLPHRHPPVACARNGRHAANVPDPLAADPDLVLFAGTSPPENCAGYWRRAPAPSSRWWSRRPAATMRRGS